MAENIYLKLSQMRVELQGMGLKKSGYNEYSKYHYYELADFLPAINELQRKYKTCSFISFSNEMAVLTMVNAEVPEEKLVWTSPMRDLELKAAHAIQNLGGVETYQRRYLYMAAFEIVENDYFDSVQGKKEIEAKSKRDEAAAIRSAKKDTKPQPVENTPAPRVNDRLQRISEDQMRALYALAEAAGFGKETVDKSIIKDFKVLDPREMSKEQFDLKYNKLNELVRSQHSEGGQAHA